MFELSILHPLPYLLSVLLQVCVKSATAIGTLGACAMQAMQANASYASYASYATFVEI
jgi:hypothetical protein